MLVRTSYKPAPDGVMYREGALAQVVLVGAGGAVVDRQVTAPGHAIEFADVKPGDYQIRAALRPCDGNCGYLDPPTDKCSEAVTVKADAEVRIAFTPTRPCTVRVDA